MSKGNIFKIKRNRNYTVIGNDIINNSKLSWGARGLLIYLLSKPSHWEVRMSDLINGSSKEGKTRVQSLLKELTNNGYVRLFRGRIQGLDGKERFGSYYEVSDTPYTF